MAYKEPSNKAKLAKLRQDIIGDGIKESKLDKYVFLDKVKDINKKDFPSAFVTETYTEGDDIVVEYAVQNVRIVTDNDSVFKFGDIIKVGNLNGYTSEGELNPNSPLLAIVVSAEPQSKGLHVIAVDGITIEGVTHCLPTIPVGTELKVIARDIFKLYK